MPEGKDPLRTLDDPEPTSILLGPNCGFSMGPATIPSEKVGFHAARYKSQVTLNCGYRILFEQSKPNAFWRFWYWFLLGWKWENL